MAEIIAARLSTIYNAVCQLPTNAEVSDVSRSWGRGSTRAWRKVRAAVLLDNLAETGGKCLLKVSPDCTGAADCVHHTRGRRVSGDDPRFLVAACTPCNLKVGDPTATTADPPGRSMTRWA